MELKDIGEVPEEVIGNGGSAKGRNMNEIVGTHDIYFLCLDTLRYDVAMEALDGGDLKTIEKYGRWEKRHAPGNYTFPSHMAMFTGFFPSPVEPIPLQERGYPFFPKKLTGGRANKNSFAFEGETFINGLERVGYETICVGGVGFFDKRTDIGKVLPSYFKESYWSKRFSCTNTKSAENQVDFAIKKLRRYETSDNIFMYLNFTSIHYPNYYHLGPESKRKDSKESHRAALKYVDGQLGRFFDYLEKRDKPAYIFLISDHGTCYGEDGYQFHCLSHPIVYEVPYMEFSLRSKKG